MGFVSFSERLCIFCRHLREFSCINLPVRPRPSNRRLLLNSGIMITLAVTGTVIMMVTVTVTAAATVLVPGPDAAGRWRASQAPADSAWDLRGQVRRRFNGWSRPRCPPRLTGRVGRAVGPAAWPRPRDCCARLCCQSESVASVYSLAVSDSVSEAAQLRPGESLARIADSESRYAPSMHRAVSVIGPEHPVAACGSG